VDASDKATNIRAFLTRAAHDDNFRDQLESGSADDVRELLKERFGIDVRIPESRTIPPKDVCKELLVWSCWLEEYAEVAIADIAYQAICFVVGHAMPLVVTTEDAVVAAG
jgi:hypothetical protein